MEDRAVRLAKSINRHKLALRTETAELLELLPQLRVQTGKGPKDLEALLDGAVERGTISRRTAEAVGTARSRNS